MFHLHLMNVFIALILITLVFYSISPLYIKLQAMVKRKFTTLYTTHMFDLEFDYIINNKCTNDEDIRAIQIVTSSSINTEARSALRKAYSHEELRQLGIYRVFLLALLKPGTSNITQEAILNENDKYNDIIQGDFFDDYRNLTFKNLMGIRWAVTECVAPLIIKMDDDIVADLYSLMEVIESKKNTPFDLLGMIYENTEPTRVEGNKWFVTIKEYEPNTYPPYESGWLYVLKNQAAKQILYASQSEKFFWVDDVFVTGVLAQKANLILANIGEYYTYNIEDLQRCITEKVKCKYIVGPSIGDYNITVDFQRHSKTCRFGNMTEYTNETSKTHLII